MIRAWAEPDSTEPLRARIRMTGDISKGLERTLTLVEVAAVVELVEAWLFGIVRPS
jgi:hypothetical protein